MEQQPTVLSPEISAKIAKRKSREVPEDMRSLRACLYCSMIKSADQFEQFGCSNCESFMHLKGNRSRVFQCTSATFDGVVSMMEPESSWVARWQRINGKTFAKGVYALSVHGRLPLEVVQDIQREGKKYIPRDRQ